MQREKSTLLYASVRFNGIHGLWCIQQFFVCYLFFLINAVASLSPETERNCVIRKTEIILYYIGKTGELFLIYKGGRDLKTPLLWGHVPQERGGGSASKKVDFKKNVKHK